jgi:hypothetical protein
MYSTNIQSIHPSNKKKQRENAEERAYETRTV